MRKEVYTNGVLSGTQYYVRDVAGAVMAIYSEQTQIELPIYGASRLGIYHKNGDTNYELTDHLGNVRAVVTKDNPTPSLFADYYPGGMQMPNRNVQGDYRYNYQGQELDNETGKVAFQLRLYDSRINRWLTTDPAGQYHSPYMSMGNNWVSQIDPDGAKADDWIKNNKTGEVKWFDGTSDEALASAAIHWDLGIGTDATENLTNLGSSFFGTMTDNIFDNSQIQEQQIAYLMDVSNRIDNLSGAKISEFGDNIIFVKLSSFFSVNRESTSVSNSPSMLGVANDLFGLDLLENELRGTHVGSGLKVFNTLTTYLNPQKTSLGASRSLIESTIPKFELN